MSFLRRLLGQSGNGDDLASSAEASSAGAPSSGRPDGSAGDDVSERAYELELARAEQERTDELMRRQQRYADYAWTPPAQGGERRADDEDAGRS